LTAVGASVLPWRRLRRSRRSSTIALAQDSLDVIKRALADAHETRESELQTRRDNLAGERHLLQLRELQRISETVGRIGAHLREVAPKGVTVVRVRVEHHHLRTALAIFATVGGPELPRCKKLAEAPQHMVGLLVEDVFDELLEAAPAILDAPPAAVSLIA
jgi:hypothetical protein